MAHCFSLTREGEPHPASPSEIDDDLRATFGVPPDPKEYLCGWYASVGMRLAVGMDWPTIRADLAEYESLVRIVDFLASNYTAAHWRE